MVRFQFQSQCPSLLLQFIQCLLQLKCIYREESALHLSYKQRIHSVFILYLPIKKTGTGIATWHFLEET